MTVTAPRTRSGRALVSVVVVLAAALALVALRVPGANGAFIAKITNSTNNAATNPYFTCGGAAADVTNLKGYFVYPLSNAVAKGTATDATNNGNTGTYAATGVASTTDTTVCPRDKLGAVTTFTGTGTTNSSTTSGAGGYVVGPTAKAIAGPNTFSIAAWFKTTAAGGMIIGFGDSATTASSGSYDRHLYIGSDGLLYFGVYNGSTFTTNSSAKVNDGTWHYAVGTFTASSLILYVDGKQVGTTNTGTTTAQGFSGYWRVGYDNLAGWPAVPTNYYFNGSMAWAGVYTAVLSATQVAQLYAAGH